jgi:hypothetical protein
MRGCGVRGLAVIAVVLGTAGRVAAQTTSGAVRGIVTDSARRPMRGVTIRIAQTDLRRISNANGEFLFDRLTPGLYRLTATMIRGASRSRQRRRYSRGYGRGSTSRCG